MSDLSFQQFGNAQSAQMPYPPTIAAAATIAPTTGLTFVTGTTQVATITPPVSGYCRITLIFTNASPGALLTSGNIKTGSTPVQNQPLDLFYDPSSAKWWVGKV